LDEDVTSSTVWALVADTLVTWRLAWQGSFASPGRQSHTVPAAELGCDVAPAVDVEHADSSIEPTTTTPTASALARRFNMPTSSRVLI
jgi:hypothetical protein